MEKLWISTSARVCAVRSLALWEEGGEGQLVCAGHLLLVWENILNGRRDRVVCLYLLYFAGRLDCIRVCVCTRTYTQTWHVKYSNVSPGVRTRQLESPKNLGRLSLGIYVFVYSYMCTKYTCIDWCCFYYSIRNSLVALLEALFARYIYISLYLHIFTCTYRGTHTQTHMYNQHTRGMATIRHRNLVERGGRKALLETLHTHNKNIRKTRNSRI